MRRRHFIAVLGAALLAAPPAMAQIGSHDRARRAYESGQVRSLGDILSGIRGQVPGRMVDAELQNRRGRHVYRLKMLDRKGRVRNVYVDGKSGRIIGKGRRR